MKNHWQWFSTLQLLEFKPGDKIKASAKDGELVLQRSRSSNFDCGFKAFFPPLARKFSRDPFDSWLTVGTVGLAGPHAVWLWPLRIR
jgi:hypothetical protein